MARPTKKKQVYVVKERFPYSGQPGDREYYVTAATDKDLKEFEALWAKICPECGSKKSGKK